ncbi:MAG: TolC family protein [Bryobacterales bacterium]|nr:TolC family protein [Bryobacterales bacterium]
MIRFLLAAQALVAQTSLTVEEAVALALKNHPDGVVARASRDVAAAQVQTAAVLPQPELRVSFNNFAIDPEMMEARSNLGVRWSPPRPREMALQRQVAQARQSGVDASVRGFEARLAAETRLAFRRAAIAAERAGTAQQAVTLRARVLDVVRRQVAAGLKEASEADLAELTVADAEAELRRARGAADTELRTLRRWMGVSDASPYVLAPEPGLMETPAAVLLRADPQAEAARMRTELQQAATACRETDLIAAIARNQRYPWISFTQVTRRVSTLENRGPWSFQFGVDLPLFRTQAKAEQKVAEAQGSRCRAQQKALEWRVRNEVSEAMAALETARQELAEMERVRLGIAAKAWERAKTALAGGRSDQVDVLLAEVRTVALRERWLERRMEYARLEAQYEHAVGGMAQ